MSPCGCCPFSLYSAALHCNSACSLKLSSRFEQTRGCDTEFSVFPEDLSSARAVTSLSAHDRTSVVEPENRFETLLRKAWQSVSGSRGHVFPNSVSRASEEEESAHRAHHTYAVELFCCSRPCFSFFLCMCTRSFSHRVVCDSRSLSQIGIAHGLSVAAFLLQRLRVVRLIRKRLVGPSLHCRVRSGRSQI